MSHPLPELNTLVRVCIGEGDREGYASRVESRDGLVLTLAAPSFAGDLFVTRAGMGLVVRWTGSRGVFEVDGLLEAVDRDESVLVWTIRTVGDIRLAQRRRYVRVAFTDPVILRPAGPPAEGSGVIVVMGIDLGEGGLRVRGPAGACQVGDALIVEFHLDAVVMTVPGTVLRSAPWAGAPGVEAEPARGVGVVPERRDEIVIAFDEPVPAEDVIRRWVLRQQVLARRRGRAPW